MPLIEPRKKAPTFILKDQVRKKRSLKDYQGRILVLYFFPKSQSAACSNQAAQFRDHHLEFRKIKAAVVGVCPETPEQLELFVQHHALPFTLLADEPDGNGVPVVSDLYGAWQPKVASATRYLGVVRTTYLLCGGGTRFASTAMRLRCWTLRGGYTPASDCRRPMANKSC
jgi:peroxiredoxin Q/BCP